MTGPILGGVMYERLPRRPEISCRVGGSVQDCSTGAAWTCFIFALVLLPVIGACVYAYVKMSVCERKEGGPGPLALTYPVRPSVSVPTPKKHNKNSRLPPPRAETRVGGAPRR